MLTTLRNLMRARRAAAAEGVRDAILRAREVAHQGDLTATDFEHPWLNPVGAYARAYRRTYQGILAAQQPGAVSAISELEARFGAP